MTAPSRTADEIIADWHAGRADHDPYDEIGGLVVEVGRLRSEVVEAEQATAEFGSLLNELARTEGDLGVAIREAAAARETLQAMRPLLAHVNDSVPTIGIPAALRLIDAALDKRLAPEASR